MISVGILDGAGSTEARRRGPRYRLLTLIAAVCFSILTGSYLSHASHNHQSFDVQKRTVLDDPLGYNESFVSLPQELVSPELVPRAASQELWEQKVLSGRRCVKTLQATLLPVWCFLTPSYQLGRASANNIDTVSGLNQKLFAPYHLLTARTGIWCMMKSDEVQVRTVTQQLLESTGWEESEEEGLADAWRENVGAADGLMNTANEFARSWYHGDMWTGSDGRRRRPSTASYGNIVNGRDGYIIAGSNYAPWDTKPDDVETWELPDIKWTDIAAVQWNQYAADNDLKRVYRSYVKYWQSQALIETALEKSGKSGKLSDLPLWPGYDFEPGTNPDKTPMKAATEAFMGLLGSSHAAGPAYLVIQYRAIFGKKRINKIKVWKSEHNSEPNMFLYMEDVL